MRGVVRALPGVLVLVAMSVTAQAHTGVHPLGIVDSASAGFIHPLSGLDHLLTMIAVGLWAAALGGVSLWVVPAAFVGLMAVGAAFGMAGVMVPGIEIGIITSVVGIGVLLATVARMRPVLAAAVVGAFAFFHGQAHGAEMPTMAAPFHYALGFVTCTAVLHGVGMAFGSIRESKAAKFALRAAGVVIAAIGVAGMALLV